MLTGWLLLGVAPASAATGDLAQASGTNACIQVTPPANEPNNPSSLCAMATLGAGISESSVVATYGSQVYVATSSDSSPIEVLQANGTGGLSDVQCLDVDGGADGGNGDCTTVAELDGGVADLVVSPDGKWVYETENGGGNNVINVFARDSSTGELTWESCISSDGDTNSLTGVCATDSDFQTPGRHLAVNPVTGEVYTSYLGTVSWLSANQTTGALTEGGCVGAGCGSGNTDNSPLATTSEGDGEIAVSADGKFLYSAPEDSDGVEWFPINSDGSLSVNTNTGNGPTDGCVQDIDQASVVCGTGAAAQIRGLRNSEGTVVLSPDAQSQWVYLLSSVRANVGGTTGFPGTVLVLQRNSQTGAVTQSATATGCISSDGTDGESQGPNPQPSSGPCEQSDPSLEDGLSLAPSLDGQSLYVLTQGDNGVSSTPDNGSTVEELGVNDFTGALTESGPTNGTWNTCYGSPGSSDGFPGTSCNNTFFGLAGQANTTFGGGQLVAPSSDGTHLYATDGSDGGVAIFQRTLPPQYAVNTATVLAPESAGPGGTATPSSSSAEANCTGTDCTVYPNATVTLTASPNSGYRLKSWSGGSCSGDLTTCTVAPVNADETDTATFVQRFTVTGEGSANGNTVTASDSSANAPSCAGDACTVDAADSVTLTATAATGYRTTGFSGGGCGPVSGYETTAMCTVSNVDANTTVTASFLAQDQVSGPNSLTGGTVQVSVPSSDTTSSCTGATSPQAGCWVDPGSAVTVTAVPSTGFSFTGWSTGGCSSQNPAPGLACNLTNVRASEVDTPGFVAGMAPSGNVLYVSPSGSNGGTGTQALPYQTLCYALGTAAASNGLYNQIVMAAGTYDSSSCPQDYIDLTSADDGFTIYGGYNTAAPDGWQPSSSPTELDGSPQAMLLDGATGITLENLDLVGSPDANLSAYGIREINGSSVTTDDAHVTADNAGGPPAQPGQQAQGASGGPGGAGNAGWGGEGAPCLSPSGCTPSFPDSYGAAGLGGNGAPGTTGADGGCGGEGGHPGSASGTTNAYGAPPGFTACTEPRVETVLVVTPSDQLADALGSYPAGSMLYDTTEDYYGTGGDSPAGGGSGGAGGQYYGSQCTSGSCNGQSGTGGAGGSPGAAGTTGSGGAQPASEDDAWVGGSGGSGGDGTPGGGGGGGAGGSGAYCPSGLCFSSWGDAGGGGGGGAAGGIGGTQGAPGGGSFGMYLADSSTATLQYGTVVTAGNGGNGGQGGAGGEGGNGGPGGLGATHNACANEICTGYGGDGGAGGQGGPGGPGGGGEGGPSYAVYTADSGSTVSKSTDTLTNAGAPGVGGLDGNSQPSGLMGSGGSTNPCNSFCVPNPNLPTLATYAIISGSYVTTTVACPSSAPSCSGQAVIIGSSTTGGAADAARVTVLGRASFKIKGHKPVSLRIKLTAAGRQLVKKLRKHHQAAITMLTVTLKVPHKGAKRYTQSLELVSKKPSPYGSTKVKS